VALHSAAWLARGSWANKEGEPINDGCSGKVSLPLPQPMELKLPASHALQATQKALRPPLWQWHKAFTHCPGFSTAKL